MCTLQELKEAKLLLQQRKEACMIVAEQYVALKKQVREQELAIKQMLEM